MPSLELPRQWRFRRRSGSGFDIEDLPICAYHALWCCMLVRIPLEAVDNPGEHAV